MTASASAPTVVSAIATRLIGPYPASDAGRLKMPTPMMLPTISAVAAPRPSVPRASWSARAAGGPAGGADAVLMKASLGPGAAAQSTATHRGATSSAADESPLPAPGEAVREAVAAADRRRSCPRSVRVGALRLERRPRLEQPCLLVGGQHGERRVELDQRVRQHGG